MFEFIETPFFTKALERISMMTSTASYRHLNEHSDFGKVVPGSGGVRKLRWAAEGRGKRGGLRVTYYVRLVRGQIWMLTPYGKNVREDIPAHILKAMKEEIEDEEDD